MCKIGDVRSSATASVTVTSALLSKTTVLKSAAATKLRFEVRAMGLLKSELETAATKKLGSWIPKFNSINTEVFKANTVYFTT